MPGRIFPSTVLAGWFGQPVTDATHALPKLDFADMKLMILLEAAGEGRDEARSAFLYDTHR